MVRPISKIVIGNPAPKNSSSPVKSIYNSPVTLHLESLDSKLDFDLDGNMEVNANNILIKGQNLVQELNSQTTTTKEKIAFTALQIFINSLESLYLNSDEINIAGKNVNLSSDSTTSLNSRIINLGSLNPDSLNRQSDGEIFNSNEQELIYNLNTSTDWVMTGEKYKAWYQRTIVLMANEIIDMRTKYNNLVTAFLNHVHGGVSTGSSSTLPTTSSAEQVSTSNTEKARSIETLFGSNTTRAL